MGTDESASLTRVRSFCSILRDVPFICDLCKLSLGKISLQFPLCFSLCLAGPCRMLFSISFWTVESEAGFKVHKADLYRGLHIVAQYLMCLPRKLKREWTIVICISEKVFCIQFTCIRGRWFGIFQDVNWT